MPEGSGVPLRWGYRDLSSAPMQIERDLLWFNRNDRGAMSLKQERESVVTVEVNKLSKNKGFFLVKKCRHP